MKLDEVQHITGHLVELAKRHGLTIITGTAEQMKSFEEEMDGMCVYITDGKRKTEVNLDLVFPSKNRRGKEIW